MNGLNNEAVKELIYAMFGLAFGIGCILNSAYMFTIRKSKEKLLKNATFLGTKDPDGAWFMCILWLIVGQPLGLFAIYLSSVTLKQVLNSTKFSGAQISLVAAIIVFGIMKIRKHN